MFNFKTPSEKEDIKGSNLSSLSLKNLEKKEKILQCYVISKSADSFTVRFRNGVIGTLPFTEAFLEEFKHFDDMVSVLFGHTINVMIIDPNSKPITVSRKRYLEMYLEEFLQMRDNSLTISAKVEGVEKDNTILCSVGPLFSSITFEDYFPNSDIKGIKISDIVKPGDVFECKIIPQTKKLTRKGVGETITFCIGDFVTGIKKKREDYELDVEDGVITKREVFIELPGANLGVCKNYYTSKDGIFKILTKAPNGIYYLDHAVSCLDSNLGDPFIR